MKAYTDVSAAAWEYDPAGPTGTGKYLLISVGDRDLIEPLVAMVGEDRTLVADGRLYLQLTNNQVSDAAYRAMRNAEDIAKEADAFQAVEPEADVPVVDEARVEELTTRVAEQEVELLRLQRELKAAKRKATPDISEPKPPQTNWSAGTEVQVTDQSVGYRNQKGRVIKPAKINGRPAYHVRLNSAGELLLLQSQLRQL